MSGRSRGVIAAVQGAQSAVRAYGSLRMLSLMAMCEIGGWALRAPQICLDEG
ncbi:hypothetical protein ACFYZ2_40620 [Streptomyces sviceus]|uniref:hypothetical protein n=1 Tax=Streptomyces sviceus TaxID=285530 RepID=UPI00368A7331